MIESWSGLHVVVTGGLGELGAAVVRRLAADGAECHLPVRSARGRGAGLPAGVRVVEGVDLGDERSVGAFYRALPELWGSIHCAGGFRAGPLGTTTLDDFAAMWSVNAVSTFLCCREAIRRMRAGSGGRIVNVAARAALVPASAAGMAAYAASKAAIAALTESIAAEVAREGIWVNAVAPSILDTPANRDAIPGADFSLWPSLDDAAETIVFLASPRNRATRGAVVSVFGRS